MSCEPLNVLIHSQPDNDWHAVLVESALKARGHNVIRYFGSDLPDHAEIEFSYDKSGSCAFLHTLDGTADLCSIDVLWNRRIAYPTSPTAVAPEDREYVRAQLRSAHGAIDALASGAFCINPKYAAMQADYKPYQLAMATKCGLSIPPTLITNRDDRLREFIDAQAAVIHKPLRGYGWDEEDKRMGTYTALVTAESLEAASPLRYTPAIFQAKIEKQFEVRAQFFGDSCFAMKIDPSRIAYGEMDWRLHQSAGMVSGQVTLPEPVFAACRRLMKALGLVAGAFDFIVTPQDEWIYLEVNEAGQFIFLEMWCPELQVFDGLCGLIESRNPNYRHQPSSDSVSYQDLMTRCNPGQIIADDKRRREQTTQGHKDAAAAPSTAAI
ncbi:ATP-grasp domain-containing protein [Lysobacter terrae]